MKKLTDASLRLNAFVNLLRNNAGLDIHAQIRLTDPTGPSRLSDLLVELIGPDSSLLTARNGELLDAIEHIAASVLRIEVEERYRLSFDADNFKAKRDRALQELAHAAIVKVRTTCSAYTFPPMMSRERRLLHLALASSGLKSASTGERFHRSVVLYPEDIHPPSK